MKPKRKPLRGITPGVAKIETRAATPQPGNHAPAPQSPSCPECDRLRARVADLLDLLANVQARIEVATGIIREINARKAASRPQANAAYESQLRNHLPTG